LFGSVEKTSGVNAGNCDTYVFEFSGVVVDGGLSVFLEDGFGNRIKVDSGAFSTGDSVKFELVKMVDSGDGVFVSEYGVVSVNDGTGFVRTRRVSTVTGFGLLRVGAGVNVSTVTATNLSGVGVKFRDGFVD
jgi:hypothetical protein